MDLNLVKWLNMVWGALEQTDAEKRADMLVSANAFLEQTRELQATDYDPVKALPLPDAALATSQVSLS